MFLSLGKGRRSKNIIYLRYNLLSICSPIGNVRKYVMKGALCVLSVNIVGVYLLWTLRMRADLKCLQQWCAHVCVFVGGGVVMVIARGGLGLKNGPGILHLDRPIIH